MKGINAPVSVAYTYAILFLLGRKDSPVAQHPRPREPLLPWLLPWVRFPLYCFSVPKLPAVRSSSFFHLWPVFPSHSRQLCLICCSLVSDPLLKLHTTRLSQRVTYTFVQLWNCPLLWDALGHRFLSALGSFAVNMAPLPTQWLLFQLLLPASPAPLGALSSFPSLHLNHLLLLSGHLRH